MIGGAPIIAVQYVFDQSGFVDAAYAVPNPRFKLRGVEERHYRGRCVNDKHLETSLQQFRDKRDRIYAVVNDQPELGSRTRIALLKYIDRFYKVMDDPRNVKKQFCDKCI